MQTAPTLRVLVYILLVGLAVSSPGSTVLAQDNGPAAETTTPGEQNRPAKTRHSANIWRARPMRRDGPLRDVNISDMEVREIQAVSSKIYPGAIINISGVTEDCPCENGPTCDSEVWIVAHKNGFNNGLMLSRIEEKWVVGPLQQWWLEYDRLTNRFYGKSWAPGEDRRQAFRNFQDAQQRHIEAFPRCSQ